MRRGTAALPRRVIMLFAASVAITSGLTACGGASQTPQTTTSAFVADWNRSDWTGMSQYVDRPAPGFSVAGPALTAGLGATRATHTLGTVSRKGSTATVPVTSAYTLPGIGTWSVNTTLDLIERSGRWLVQWSPAAVDPSLRTGEHLQLTPNWAPRAPILGNGGVPLTVQGPMVLVGIEGSRVKDESAVTAALLAAGATATEVQSAFGAAALHPTYFEPVFTMPESRFDALGGRASAVYQIAGTVFEFTSTRTALTPGLGAHVVGTVGPVTAQELRQLGPPYDSTSTVGQAGLEAAYQKQLAGRPGATIAVVGAKDGSSQVAAVLSPKPGIPVDTSIDAAVQEAAESALAPVSQFAALVAVRASTGQVLAAVSVPNAYQFDQALDGEFPPGSTFKVITASALIEDGLSPASPATCPMTLTVDGEPFHNAEGDAPVANMAQAFAESCNTAFIGLTAADLQPGSLPAAAAMYGIGTTPEMGLAAYGGSAPVPHDEASLASMAIGAQVLVSPLNLAMVAAAVDTGVVRAPRLVVGAPDDVAPTHVLPVPVVAGLQQMMADVVTNGTAAGTGLPAGTYAKTGTAEYGTGTPPSTDAWLIGYRGDIAFAVVVQGTGNGGPSDGPIIARFLDALGPSS